MVGVDGKSLQDALCGSARNLFLRAALIFEPFCTRKSMVQFFSRQKTKTTHQSGFHFLVGVDGIEPSTKRL